jgi:hypothetical protein
MTVHKLGLIGDLRFCVSSEPARCDGFGKDLEHSIRLGIPIEVQFTDTMLPAGLHLPAKVGRLRELNHRSSESGDEAFARIWGNTNAAGIINVLAGPAPIGCDHWNADRHRFEQHGAAAFAQTGEDQHIRFTNGLRSLLP